MSTDNEAGIATGWLPADRRLRECNYGRLNGLCRGRRWAAVPSRSHCRGGSAQTERHAGQADIVRELVDGAAGLRPGNDNMPPVDSTWWADY